MILKSGNGSNFALTSSYPYRLPTSENIWSRRSFETVRFLGLYDAMYIASLTAFFFLM